MLTFLLAWLNRVNFQEIVNNNTSCPVAHEHETNKNLTKAVLSSLSGGGGCPKHAEYYISECPSAGAVAQKTEEIDPLNAVSFTSNKSEFISIF